MPLLLLPDAEGDVHQSGGHKSQDPTDVGAVRAATDARGDRTDPPDLTHAQQGKDSANDPSDRRGNTVRQLGAVIPSGKVVLVSASPYEVLEEKDRGEGNDPVRADEQEVLHGLLEMVAAGHGGCQENDCTDQRPHKTRDDHQLASDHLHAQAERVDVGRDDGDTRQADQDLDELAEPAGSIAVRSETGADETTDATGVVGVCEVRVRTQVECTDGGAK